MPSLKPALDARGKKLAAAAGLDEAKVAAVAEGILASAKANKLDLSGDIVIGLDVNGPIVAVDNNDLMPLPHAKECVEYLMQIKGITVALMTGWDLSSMTFFRDERMGLGGLGIVGEYGMVYKKGDRVTFIYPYSDAEALGFIQTAIDIAADAGLKFAIQGNYSSGVGPVIVEADHNGHLFEHPLVKGRIPTIEKIHQEAKGKSKCEFRDGKIYFENKVENLQGIFEALARKHPLISVRYRRVKGDLVSLEMDANDKPGFKFPDLQKLGETLTKRTGRRCMVYEDFGIDCFAKAVDDGDYYKQSGLHAYGKDVLAGAPFVKIIVGDKANDAPKVFEGTLFCPQVGTQAEKYAAEKKIPSALVGDVRDFALAMGAIRTSLTK
jgi:hydroxymethylpyrimidine pyrophosphatase-like HAD family hydrolase